MSKKIKTASTVFVLHIFYYQWFLQDLIAICLAKIGKFFTIRLEEFVLVMGHSWLVLMIQTVMHLLLGLKGK